MFQRYKRSAGINVAWLAFLASIAVLIALVGLLAWSSWRGPAQTATRPLLLYCAAGIRPPVAEAARDYQKEYGVEVQLQYGGSQTLLANIEASKRGDLYLPADDSYLQIARDKGLVRETLPLARMTPVLAVPKDNPKNLHSLADLERNGVRVGQANPEAAAVGKLTADALKKAGKWADLEKHIVVMKPTVNDVANDVVIGAVDAGFVWDATVRQMPKLEAVPIPEFADVHAHIAVGVLTCGDQPTAALRFARYLAARDKGLPLFERDGYEPADGDPWAEAPELRVFAGAMLRPAIDDTIDEFEKREGVRVSRVYNGCGILVGQMRTDGKSPDAYFACDVSFMNQVHDLFLEATPVSTNQLVILVPKGNPHHIRSLNDLGKAGLRVGVGNEKQCAMGALTQETLKQGGVHDPVMDNVKVQSPTGDLLVNELRTGSLDAVIAYVSNGTAAADQLDAVAIKDIPCAVAVQPVAVGKDSAYKQLTGRLLDALRSPESRRRFEAYGFHWKAAGEIGVADPVPKEAPPAHRAPSDAPFFLALSVLGGAYVLLIVGMLTADASYTPPLRLWQALGSPAIRYAVWLSLISCSITAILSVWVAVPLGYLLSRFDFPGRTLLDVVIDLPIVLPPLVVGLSLLILFQTPPGRLVESVVPVTYAIPSVILAQFSVACAFAVRTMRVTFDQIPRRREEVAMTLGCSRGQAFWRVTLPEARRGVVAAFTLAWARALGEFGPILVFSGATRFRTEVLSTTVFLELSVGNLEGALAVSLLMIAVAVVVLVIVRIFGAEKALA